MKCLAHIISSEQFSFDGKRYVKLQGLISINGSEKKLFEQTVREELVPDSLEGKDCLLEFEIGIAKFKPYLRLKSIVFDN